MAEVPPRAEIQFPWTWNMTNSNASERSSEIKFLKKSLMEENDEITV